MSTWPRCRTTGAPRSRSFEGPSGPPRRPRPNRSPTTCPPSVWNDTFFVSYAAFKSHYSLFPASAGVVEALGEEIQPYLVGQGTIRFPVKAPIPLDLVAKVVRARLTELGARKSR
jgi:hypothetical protein